MTVLEIETESAGTYPDATEETLERLLGQMGPENSYLILHRSDLPDGPEGPFVQTAIRRDPGGHPQPGFVVEYKEGPERHFQAFTEDFGTLHAILAGWAFGRPGWRDLVDWERLELRPGPAASAPRVEA